MSAQQQPFKRKKTRSKKKNLRRDTRSADVKFAKFGHLKCSSGAADSAASLHESEETAQVVPCSADPSAADSSSAGAAAAAGDDAGQVLNPDGPEENALPSAGPEEEGPSGKRKKLVTKRKKNQDKCFNCGKFGHWGKDCPLADKREARGAVKSEAQGDAVCEAADAGEADVGSDWVADGGAGDGAVLDSDETAPEENRREKSAGPSGEVGNSSSEKAGKKRKREKSGAEKKDTWTGDSTGGPEGDSTESAERKLAAEEGGSAEAKAPAKKRRKKEKTFVAFVGQLHMDATEEALRCHAATLELPEPTGYLFDRLEFVTSSLQTANSLSLFGVIGFSSARLIYL